MKKGVISGIICIFSILLLLSFVLGVGQIRAYNSDDNSTANGNNNNNNNDIVNQTQDRERARNETGNGTNVQNQGIGQELRERIRERKGELKEGNYTGPMGQELRVREITRELKELRVNNHNATTRLNISQETDEQNMTRLKVRLKNGEEKDINIMPDAAHEMALERLRLRNCTPENNCSLELKESDNNKTIYEFSLTKKAKFLWMFKTEKKVMAEIDAETGEVIREKRLWWGFLAPDSN